MVKEVPSRSIEIGSHLIFAAGLISIGLGTAIFLIPNPIDDVPAHLSYVGARADQIVRSSPRLYELLAQETKLVGAFILGYGILMSGVAYSPYRKGERWAWYVVLFAVLAAALGLRFAALHHPLTDIAFLIPIVGIGLAITGLILPANRFLSKK